MNKTVSYDNIPLKFVSTIKKNQITKAILSFILTTKLGRNSYFMTIEAYLVTNKVCLGVTAARFLALQNRYGDVATPATYMVLTKLG
ncbi:MAG: hypothetical protein WCQ95_11985 [Bacteroidota bacterium]